MKKRVTRKRLIFRTQYNSPVYTGKEMSTETLTVPDQNMSIKTLLDRHSRGLPLGVSEQKGEYFDTEVPRFDDLTDMVAYKKELAIKHKELMKKAEDEISAKKAATVKEPVEEQKKEKSTNEV
tara:strand:- start:376 stop:744 length:369 start_codon:yes stop_codon:yes gene_type:complete